MLLKSFHPSFGNDPARIDDVYIDANAIAWIEFREAQTNASWPLLPELAIVHPKDSYETFEVRDPQGLAILKTFAQTIPTIPLTSEQLVLALTAGVLHAGEAATSANSPAEAVRLAEDMISAVEDRVRFRGIPGGKT